MEDRLLSVENLVVHILKYPENKILKAVDGISFSVSKNEILGIVGQSGAGKTMTALAILRLLPEAAKITSGRIILLDRLDIIKLSEEEMQKKVRGRLVSMIFQDPVASFNPTYKIGAQIQEVITSTLNCRKEEAQEIAIKYLQDVALQHPKRILHAYPHALSGGMLQRVMIAQALIPRPKLLIADEPTSCLDTTTQAQILNLLKILQQKYNFAMILITHDLSIISALAKRMIVMYKGKIVETGKTSNILKTPKHPYTAELLSCTRYFNITTPN